MAGCQHSLKTLPVVCSRQVDVLARTHGELRQRPLSLHQDKIPAIADLLADGRRSSQRSTVAGFLELIVGGHVA